MMSFRLMGRELLRTKPQLAWKTMDLDAWLDATCRDILDESDAILDPRFQLVYSIGNQRIMDGQPDRWVITQRLLALFASEAYRLQTEGSRDIEVDFRGRSFPMITFLNHDVGHILLDRVVEQIGRGKLLGISLLHCSAAVRQAVLEFIRESSVCESTLTLVEQEFGSSASWKILLLCRGLIANNVLLFALQQKRWLVNYGLDLSRCRMAVPYRAKGVPSISAEFGHPDVAIVLTCLSYYYSGLTSTQLRHAFENLFRESDPSSEYALWAQDCPTLSIQSLHGINLEDDRSWDETILPQLRFSKSAADYFMATVVFPHEGKEFPAKLSTSAWDIPSKSQPSTGFSGTNDNKFLLPLSIHQNDLPQLHRTNAMVANMLLQRENRQYVEAKDSCGKRLSTEGLLKLLCASSPQISVFIDVGAQVLEASNEDVARKWLQLSPNADAAVFFDEADEKRVLDRHGFVERLSNSGFHQNLDRCLIYLDEVHTRGVDISMPTQARAAVTLGPRTTKDRLVQACMRMRKLNCHHLEEPEGRTLHEMYGGGSGQPAFRSCLTSEPARQDATVQHLLSEWATFKSGHSRDWTLQEEQEREIAHEVEQERELQRPPPAEALAHTLDPAVRAFVQNGTFPENGALTTHGRADEFLRPVTWLLSSRRSDRTDVFVIISPYEANALLPALRQETAAAAVRLHVYAAKTSRAMLGDFTGLDFYTVSGTGSGEAEYTPPPPPPPLLVAQLGLLAGSLFFDSYAAYRLVADFLGIVTDAAGVGDGGVVVGADGFVQMEARRRVGWPVKSPFVRSPIVYCPYRGAR
ncbi:putative very large low complexity protein [Diplodia seriata]|uniref:ubiquitinyl hydrolase 1 n=1 Tax=Diplodia seriata TaxID=420778 RepID=A0A0G2DYS6_9PEZI|nr:putative very large low complexity protein [Diplodia seriata]